ncbi:aquaporin, putative [Bodo saltans]|uniref:Aquaporin, putative n=1 Tax=Bodo saltans TaxID=75058 RepID=A0A0S4JRP5_BODSA|nr:aquaporin, putative [Bodo saltans]|eukprot:CUG92927.1 aquaporin, putative [Bodo saltans]
MLENFFLESKWRRALLGETLGTMFLCMTVVVASAILQQQYFVALTVAAQVVGYTFVGAGFLNPAIAAGVTVIRIRRSSVSGRIGGTRMALIQFLSFVAVECVAAFAGAALGYALLGTHQQRETFPAPEPNQGLDASIPRAMLAEFVFTFQLTYAMVNTCVAKEYDRVNVNRFLGPSIGCILFVGAMIAGPISGAALNPAIATALQMFQCMIQVGSSRTNGSCRPLSFIWLYWLCELAGGVCAGLCFLLVSNEAEPSEYDEVVEVSMRPESKGEDALNGLDVTVTSVAGPRSTAQHGTERDSLLHHRARTGTLTQRRPTMGGAGGGAGMHTLLDLDS